MTLNFIKGIAIVFSAIVLCRPVTILATTMVPYQNLGVLSAASDALVVARVVKQYETNINGALRFRYTLEVEDKVKGDLEKGAQFDVQRWEKVIDDVRITMWGDIELFENARYLLFLEKKSEGLYHPLCFSYYIFEEISKEGISYIVPMEHDHDFELIDADRAEPIHVYEKARLLRSIGNYIDGKTWDVGDAITNLKAADFKVASHKREAPSDCTYLKAGSKPLRWEYFPDQAVAVHYINTGAAGCTSAISATSEAVSSMIASYPGLKLVDGGTTDPLHDCADGSALGADYRSYLDNNFGGYRNIILQYDDPCSEIADLTNCGGVLAIGGVYGIGSHTHDGTSWATAKYGYVILNNGVGNCKCNQMHDIITHELSHSLGLGHITTGNANMNPTCCNEITSLDQLCMEYSYPEPSPSQLLPLKLTDFHGEQLGRLNVLKWQTAWESNIDRFVIEKTNFLDGNYTLGAEIISKGDTNEGHQYEWSDDSPNTQNYYRLKTYDHDGDISYSHIIELNIDQRGGKNGIYPTIVTTHLQLDLGLKEEVEVEITDLTGRMIRSAAISPGQSSLRVETLPEGWYHIRVPNKGIPDVYKFCKVN